MYPSAVFRKIKKAWKKVGKSMSGNDVIIAPNIVEQMANDPDKAAYYEKKKVAAFENIISRFSDSIEEI